MNKNHFSPTAASRISKNPKKSNLVLSFLQENGFSVTQLEKITKTRPRCLIADVEKSIKPKITLFRDIGFSTNEITEIVSNNPHILQISVENSFIPALTVLKGILGSTEDVVKLLRSNNSRLFSVDLEKNFVPNVKFLKRCGVPMEEIRKQIYRIPRFYLTKTDTIRKYVDKVDELGVCRRSKSFFYAVRVVGGMTEENLELKFKAFRDLGFSEDDALRVFRNSPNVFTASEDKMRKIKEALLETEKYDVSCIVKYPSSLTMSLETRYKPRLQVLGILEKKKLIEKWPKLSTLVQMSDKKFYEKFVDPFLNELRDVKPEIVSKSTLVSMSDEIPELKFKAFLDLGFSKDDILRMYKSNPIVFTVSEDKIRKITDVLLETEKYDVSCIVKYPSSLTHSVEARYKPRLQVLGILEQKNLIEEWPDFKNLVQPSNKKFCKKFVDPFKEELKSVKLMILSKARPKKKIVSKST